MPSQYDVFDNRYHLFWSEEGWEPKDNCEKVSILQVRTVYNIIKGYWPERTWVLWSTRGSIGDLQFAEQAVLSRFLDQANRDMLEYKLDYPHSNMFPLSESDNPF